MLRPYVMVTVQQVFHPPQVPRSFFPHRGREQNGPRRRDARRDHRLGHRDERREPARIVRDARALEPVTPALDRHVHVGPEHGVEMRGQHDRRGHFSVFPEPAVDVPRVVDRDIRKPDFAEQLRDACRAPAFGAGRGGNGGERRLAGERHLVRALDMMARRTDALVCEQARDRVILWPSH